MRGSTCACSLKLTCSIAQVLTPILLLMVLRGWMLPGEKSHVKPSGGLNRAVLVQVVLPLLANEVVTTGWVSESDFLTGFALVQAMPGPLFNFAAYLGAHCRLPEVLPWAQA